MENDPNLRDLYAGLALMGLLAHGGTTDREKTAEAAFAMAEVMMKEREKQNG
jgi:hypothetical protein